ncbi:hypothetical protein D9M68_288740 [compost metagenome]
MRIVSAQELENWLANGKVLEKDARGAKVIALNDGRFLKIFHTRRLPLLARLQPAAQRFARNTQKLRQLGIPTPDITELLWLDRRAGLSACLYRPLPGDTMEQLYRREPQRTAELLPALANFIRQLHQLGVYFRSLHLGNIILLPQEHFGLIDVLDLQFKRQPLGAWLVKRNFQHLSHYLNRRRLTDFPLDELKRLYQQAGS